MTIFSKIRWVVSILLVFFIVLITNLIDKKNFTKLSYSVTTIYEDRLVASDVLFDMAYQFQQKEIAVASSDTSFFISNNASANNIIDGLINRYGQTKLTEKEKSFFNQLKKDYERLKTLEKGNIILQQPKLNKSLEEIQSNLHNLSKIQIEEGRRQAAISAKTKDSINFYTQWEIVFLIIMAVLIQIIIFYKPAQSKEEL